MSLLFLTDFHLDQYRPFSKILENGMNSRLLDQIEVAKRVKGIIDEQKPRAVIFLGDFFNGFTESLPKIIYNAGFLIAKLWSQGTDLYIVVGNHDVYRGMHVFSAFESLPHVHIISQTTQLNLDGYVVDLIPWQNPLPTQKGDVCAGHMEVYGAQMDAAYTCKSGIQPTQFEGYDYVFLGHFHNPQPILVRGAKSAQYIGSLMQTDRRRSSAGFMGVVKLEQGEVLGYSIDSPRIYDITINTKEDLDKIPNGEDYYKVIVKNEDIDVGKLDHKYSVEYDLPEIITSRLSIENTSTDWAEKLQEAVELFIEQSNTVLPKDQLKKLAKELL